MRIWPLLVGFAAVAPASATGLLIFSDNFNSGASSRWGNERGGWYASNGVYNAHFPSNNPPIQSTLPFDLTNFVLDVDIQQVCDGGIWLRWNPATQSGVLLVTGGEGWGLGVSGPSVGASLYWHVIHNGSYSGITNDVQSVFTPGQNVHLQVVVQGNLYKAYVNGVLRNTLIDGSIPHGRLGLYDFAPANALNQSFDQAFDNVQVRVLPKAYPLSPIDP